MRVADYVANFLVEKGIKHVFLITGGGAMHLNDAFAREPRLSVVCNHHEQASAISAEAYCRYSGEMAALNVTTGPGGVNALNGVYGAYVDSIAMFVVSGQVKRETIAGEVDLPLRQLGDQEVDIVSMSAPVTKYSVLISDPSDIGYELEKAYKIATEGRPGPVWLDIPIDVQAAKIDPDKLKKFNGSNKDSLQNEDWRGGLYELSERASLLAKASEIIGLIKSAKRPVILVGTGIRISKSTKLFDRIADKLSIPVVTGWNAHDLVTDDNPCFAGRPGTVGTRPGNFAVQRADLVLVLGCRLNVRQISYNFESFAQSAYRIMVDIDGAELQKPTLKLDMAVKADLKAFLTQFDLALGGYKSLDDHSMYLAWCIQNRKSYPVTNPDYYKSKKINPYVFVPELFKKLDRNDVVICANGTACVTTFQAAVIKKGQRMFTNSGCASMGYDLPAAIGAAIGGASRVICIAGDGSVMMNLQELQTIISLALPIKIFILNNNGYHSIRQTQTTYFPDAPIGCDRSSGIAFPDFVKIAKAFGFNARFCSKLSMLESSIEKTLREPGASVCEIVLDEAQSFSPKLASRVLADGTMVSPSLEDMSPFLPADELAKVMSGA
jgi:acetolactate synthase-1/2/3 large subunit